MATLENFYVEQIIDTLEFDLKLIEKMLDYTEDAAGAEKLKLDLEAIRFDIGIVLDIVNERNKH